MGATAGVGVKMKKCIREYLKGKIVGLGVSLDIGNEGEGGIKGENVQQGEFGGQGGNGNIWLGTR